MNNRGVTLIELVIVFVIIAVLAVLVAPNIGAWLPGYRLRTATREVVSTLRTAQMRAASTNTMYGVGFGANSCQLYRGTTAEGGPINLPKGVEFTNNTFPVNGTLGQPFAQFNSDSTSSGGSVRLQNSRGSIRRIDLTTATGRVAVTVITP